jgi:hypothetical protein
VGAYFAGDVPFGVDASCYLLVDSMVVCGPVDFRTALMVMFASYYVLNISYPEGAAATLEFLQRLV